MKTLRVLVVGAALCGLFNAVNFTFAQGTAFTYQGQLQNNGSLANGSYDLTFSLFNVSSGGSAVAGPLTNSATSISNGLFLAGTECSTGARRDRCRDGIGSDR